MLAADPDSCPFDILDGAEPSVADESKPASRGRHGATGDRLSNRTQIQKLRKGKRYCRGCG
eukprot:10412295-Alexandrium_andersonii.AAC.1